MFCQQAEKEFAKVVFFIYVFIVPKTNALVT